MKNFLVCLIIVVVALPTTLVGIVAYAVYFGVRSGFETGWSTVEDIYAKTELREQAKEIIRKGVV